MHLLKKVVLTTFLSREGHKGFFESERTIRKNSYRFFLCDSPRHMANVAILQNARRADWFIESTVPIR